MCILPARVSVYAMHTYSACQSQKCVSELLELEAIEDIKNPVSQDEQPLNL